MCRIVVINKGERELTTPRQFLEYFGFLPDVSPILSIDECLCGYDIELMLIKKGVDFKEDCGDIYVGMLEDIIVN